MDLQGLPRLTLPDDSTYLVRLGIALYGFASLTSFLAEVTCHIDPRRGRMALEDKVAGKLITDFENSVNEIEEREPLVGKIGTDVVLLSRN